MRTIQLLAVMMGFGWSLTLPAAAVVPPVMDIRLECISRPAREQIIHYRFYERIGTNWLLLMASPTNVFWLTNVNVIVPHTYGVSSSNVLGEADISAPYVAPSDPRTPDNLGIVQMKLTVPTNATIAGSSDLMTWQDKLTFTVRGTNLDVRFKVWPGSPVQFWKEWDGGPAPPLPGGGK